MKPALLQKAEKEHWQDPWMGLVSSKKEWYTDPVFRRGKRLQKISCTADLSDSNENEEQEALI